MTQVSANKATIELHRRGNDWAYRQLHLTGDSTTRDVRATLLKQVEQSGFVPNESLLPAFRWLQPDAATKTPSLASSDFPRQTDKAVCDEVNQFANGMFAMAVPARIQKWNELALAAYYCPRANARLKALVPGLRIELAELGQMDTVSRELANHLMGLFPLNRIAYATRRHQIVTMVASQRPAKEWKTLIRRFRAKYPAFAALDSTLLSRLADRGDEFAKIAKLERKRAVHRPVTTRRTGSDTQSYWWVLGVVLFFAIFIGRFAANQNRRSGPRINHFNRLNKQEINELMERLRRDTEKLARPPSDVLDQDSEDTTQSGDEGLRFQEGLPTDTEKDTAPSTDSPFGFRPDDSPQPNESPMVPAPKLDTRPVDPSGAVSEGPSPLIPRLSPPIRPNRPIPGPTPPGGPSPRPPFPTPRSPFPSTRPPFPSSRPPFPSPPSRPIP